MTPALISSTIFPIAKLVIVLPSEPSRIQLVTKMDNVPAKPDTLEPSVKNALKDTTKLPMEFARNVTVQVMDPQASLAMQEASALARMSVSEDSSVTNANQLSLISLLVKVSDDFTLFVPSDNYDCVALISLWM